MNIGAIFVGLAFVILVITFVVDPFRPKARQLFSKVHIGSVETEDVAGRALYALRDLTFDYETEKITEEDYKKIRANLLTQAAKEIETKQIEDTHIEKLIRSRRRFKADRYSCPECGKMLQKENRFCMECGFVRTILCTGCDYENHAEDNFCTNCGNTLKKNPDQQ